MSDQDGSEAYQHYSPEHPLPSEIRNMRRDSTVCKYCGVSYLIHNEIKMLEDKLDVCEKELAMLRGCEQREKDLKQQLAEYDSKKEMELGRRDKILGNMKQELRETQDKLIALDELKASIEQQLSTANITITSLREFQTQQNVQITQCQGELREMHQFCQDLKQSVQVSIRETQHETMDLNQKCVAQFDKYITEITTERNTYKEGNAHNEKLLKTAQNQVEKLHAQVSVIEDRCIQHECTIRRLEQRIQEQTTEMESTVNKTRSLTIEGEQFKHLLKSKATEISEMSTTLRIAREQHEQSLTKFQETVDKQAAVISQLTRDVALWSNKYNEQTEAGKEMQRKHNLSSSEIDDLKANLLRATQHVASLTQEREMSILAHQTQISDLRESFTNKLADMNLWPERLEKALSEKRQKHHEEMETLKSHLETAKVEEIGILQQKHDELLKKYTSEINENNTKHHTNVSNIKAKLESEAGRWKKLLDDAQNRFTSTETSLKAEIEGLKKIINNLESRIAKLGSEKVNLNESGSENYVRMQTDLANLQSECGKVTDELTKSQEQVASLQETVRRECEERFELTESLSAAREELLATKGIPGGRLSIHTRVSSPPIHPVSRSSTSSSNLSRRESQSIDNNPESNDSPSSQHTRTSPLSVQNHTNQTVSTSDIGFTVKNNQKSAGKIRGNSIAQHRRRIANLLGKK